MLFLSPEEIAFLTGRRRAAHQIATLRAMGIPYWTNAAGKPVVTRAAIEGRAIASNQEKRESWQPNTIKKAA